MIPKKMMGFFLTAILILFFQPELNGTGKNVAGIWMYGSTITSQGTPSIIGRLVHNEVRQVYLLVKGTLGTMTDASALTEFITTAHNNSIEVHLWYIVADDAKFIATNSNAHIYHCPKPGVNSNPYPMNDNKVNLLYPGYKEYVLANITYLLNNFNCDGIHLDVIRYSHLVYSFDQNHLAAAAAMGCNTNRLLQLFNNDYNNITSNGLIDLYSSGDPDIVKWIEMRKNVIYDYINSIKTLIQQIKPGIELSASFMPEGATNPAIADVYYSQNYALNSQVLNRIIPMTYFKEYGMSTSWLKTVTQQAISLVNPDCRITSGFQTFGSVTTDELNEQLTYALEGLSNGLVGFRYELVSDPQWNVIQVFYSFITPVELTSFTANIKKHTVILNWQTATEINNRGFEIEKLRNSDWEVIGFVPGFGTTSEARSYSYIDNKVSAGNYSYRLKQIDYDGTYRYSKEAQVNISLTPKKYELLQNFPNPFNPETIIRFEIPAPEIVTLKVYDILGREIETLINGEVDAGYHDICFNAGSLSNGTYYYRMKSGMFSSVKRMMVIK